ncbi:MAG: hypothetical protein FWD70_07520 [Desulfuromonadales bacterium]|nr:hypothetical protein [Desulfuromonadales bacterium]
MKIPLKPTMKTVLKSTIRILLILIILISIPYVFMFFAAGFGNVDISTYKGDGKIKAVGGGFLAKGVEIELSATGTNEEVFSLSGLPSIGKDYLVSVHFPETFKNMTELTVKAIDKNNNVINEFKIRPESALITSDDGGAKLYYSPEWYFRNSKEQPIDKLLISLPNNGSLDGIKIVLRAGGSL